jgi:hypothetical protein
VSGRNTFLGVNGRSLAGFVNRRRVFQTTVSRIASHEETKPRFWGCSNRFPLPVGVVQNSSYSSGLESKNTHYAQKRVQKSIFILLFYSGSEAGLKNSHGDSWRREISRSRGNRCLELRKIPETGSNLLRHCEGDMVHSNCDLISISSQKPVGRSIRQNFSRCLLNFVQKFSLWSDSPLRSTTKQILANSDFLVISERLPMTGLTSSSLFVFVDNAADFFTFSTLI